MFQDGNTALHTAALNKPAKPAVIQTLLDHGAHFDSVNHDKRAFFNLLKGQPLHEVSLSLHDATLLSHAVPLRWNYFSYTLAPATIHSLNVML